MVELITRDTWFWIAMTCLSALFFIHLDRLAKVIAWFIWQLVLLIVWFFDNATQILTVVFVVSCVMYTIYYLTGN